ncbi:hypothetical protein HY639_01350 [Candidatus Woesearchaeota archaeon]|nr:hypothetical protein [Candidatus Woesearchaeota archaeon]
MTEGKCPCCGEMVLKDGTGELKYTQCSSCKTPHHEGCFEYLGRCGIFSCGNESVYLSPKPTTDLVALVENPHVKKSPVLEDFLTHYYAKPEEFARVRQFFPSGDVYASALDEYIAQWGMIELRFEHRKPDLTKFRAQFGAGYLITCGILGGLLSFAGGDSFTGIWLSAGMSYCLGILSYPFIGHPIQMYLEHRKMKEYKLDVIVEEKEQLRQHLLKELKEKYTPLLTDGN